MSGRFYNSVAAALALGSLVSALDPADPTITAPAVLARQNDDSFIGYVQSDSTCEITQHLHDGCCYSSTVCDHFLEEPKLTTLKGTLRHATRA